MNASCDKVKFGVDGQLQLQLEEVDIVTVVDSSCAYPAFESVKDEMTEIPTKLIFNYKCESKKCEFPINALRESVELKSIGVKETIEVIARTIDSHQQLFTAQQCGGYIFRVGGKSVLMQNDSVVPSDETCFGLMDLIETRRRLIHQYELSKLRKVEPERNIIGQNARLSFKVDWSVVGPAIGGGGFAAAVLLGAVKALKKI